MGPAILQGLGKMLIPIGATIGTFLGGTAGQAASTLGLAIAIMTLFFLLRILFMLVRAYVSIVLLIIFSPLIISTGAIAPWGIRSWFMNLLANVLVFPVTGLIFGMGGIITGIIQNSGNMWQAPLLGNDQDFLAGMFSLGILLIIPELDKLIKQALNARGPDFIPPGISPQLQKGGQELISKYPKWLGGWTSAAKGRFGI